MASHPESVESPLAVRIGTALVGLLLVAVFLLPPVKAFLNGIPHFYKVFYVVLTLLAGYLVVMAAYTRQGALAIGTWALLFWAAACSAVYVFGGARIFFSLGRWGAIVFIVVSTVGILFPATQDAGKV